MNAHTLIVTIDGPAGVGKSTLAKRLAGHLDMAYLDTGAMFRTVALHLSRSGVPVGSDIPEQDGRVQSLLEECAFSLKGSGSETRLFCNGTAVGEEIRTEEAGMMAAKAGGMASVRAFLKLAQQRLGASFSLVAEGRDMGTVVFPQAACKLFLDADPGVRAERRCLQLRAMGQECDLAALAEQIRLRDEQDRNRAIAPLRPATDAVTVDTTEKDLDQVFAEVVSVVDAALRGMHPVVPMRRKKRALLPEETLDLLARAEYGVLSLDDGSGTPYGVPLSYCLYEGCLYFHAAMQGRKADALRHNPRVCFTAVGRTQPVYEDDFSTFYESAMVFGRASLVTDEREKYDALEKLAQKYLPDYMDKADHDIRHSFARTAVYRISLDQVTGKAKRPDR